MENPETIYALRLKPGGPFRVDVWTDPQPIAPLDDRVPPGWDGWGGDWRAGDWGKWNDRRYSRSVIYLYSSGDPDRDTAYVMECERKTGEHLGIRLIEMSRLEPPPDYWYLRKYPRPLLPEWL